VVVATMNSVFDPSRINVNTTVMPPNANETGTPRIRRAINPPNSNRVIISMLITHNFLVYL